MKIKILFYFLAVLMSVSAAVAQTQITVSGRVTDGNSGEPVIGATVQVKGTTLGVATDVDGAYQIKGVPANGTLTFTYIGMKPVELGVENRTTIDVQMQEDSQQLEQVVVVGYGTSKAKDLTSPITVVKGDDLMKQTTTSPMSALQGKVAGVQIVNSGAPGSGPEVRVRGVGGFGTDTQPLYVVDGMFFNNINFLNSADIENVSVLKDASAASIYGVRAANGVVIVTTKKGGLNRPTTITYDGSVGIQTATNKLKMASSQQYATMQLEKGNETDRAVLENSINKFGGDLKSMTMGVNTNWYDELLRNAIIQNHSVDLSGGSDKVSYSVGASYYFQDGIQNVENNYQRFNLRTQADYQAKKWLKVGVNVVLSNADMTSTGSGAWGSAYKTPGIIPVMDESRPDAEAFPKKYASPSQIGMSNYFGNPVAQADYVHNKSNILSILPVFYAEANIAQNKIVFRSQFSQDISVIQDRTYSDVFAVGGGQNRPVSGLTKKTNNYRNFVFDNTVTYRDTFGKHNFSAMLGQSSRQESWRGMDGTASNVPGDKEEYWYLSQGNADGRTVGDGGTTYNGLSFFGRVTYDFDGKYLLSATMRADGSSKYQEKWGYFPSVGVAWVVSSENFMKNQKVIDFLKIRASWGMLGNDKVQASDGFASIATGTGNSGVFDNTTLPGYTNQVYFSYLRWEVVNEMNFGVDIALLNNRLRFEADYYKRITQNAVFSAPLPMGAGSLLGNNGEISNSGFEFNVNWNDRIGSDISYSVGFNISTLKNRVNNLNGLPYLYGNSAEFRTISRVGDVMNAYYGYQIAGVYQNQAEIDADPIAKANNLQAGDFRYVDQNGDKMINEDDRTILGKALPDVTWGLNLGFQWKNLEFSATLQGQWGNQIVNRKRGDRQWQGDINYDAAWVENRWTGEGSTNSYMSAKGSVNPWNISKFNSWYVEDGAFWRIQNIQIAYNILTKKAGSNRPGVRVSLTADRPFTSFKSNGFTPEIANGFDDQVYPLASTYSIGLRLTL